MILIDGLRFSHGTSFTLNIPTLEISAHTRTAIVGPSGTGKTTFLSLLSGILKPDRGALTVAERPLHTMSDAERRAFRARQTGFVFQNFALIEYLTAFENILYPYRITDSLTLDATTRDRAHMLAERVGLADKLDRKPARLSQGEQQRIAICRALIAGPALVLADEAPGNLDPDNKTLILNLLFEEVANAGATLIAVTHDHQLLDRFDRVIDFATFREVAA